LTGAPVNVCQWDGVEDWIYEVVLSRIPSQFPKLRAVLAEIPNVTELEAFQLSQALTPTEIAVATALTIQVFQSVTRECCGKELLPA
jgi:hypothetical protein